MSNKINTEEFDRKYIMDTSTPRYTILSGRYKRSFAYHTLRDRLPITLTQIIDQLTRDYDEITGKYSGEKTQTELKHIVGQLSKLKYQLQTDKPLEKFVGEEPDKELWNSFIAALPKDQCSFFRTCWLYSECYLYRKVSSFFENTETLKNYDYFAKQKEKNLYIVGIVRVSKAVRRTERDQKTLCNLLKLCLWGNKCDLSLRVSTAFDPSDNLFEQLDSFNNNVLVDNTKQIWQCLQSADQSKPVIVHFVSDNTGLELYTDFVIAEYLIEKQLATTVRFSVKPIPWFVSDATPRDVTWTLNYLSTHSSLVVKEQGLKWKQYFDDGKFLLSPEEYFWVSPYEFYKMREVNPDLYKYLGEAHLVIFKGDLNYRKLLGDMCWDPTDNFLTCLRGFRPSNMCTLRTLKADIVCGLPHGKAEELYRVDAQWMCTGEYGVIQYIDRRDCYCYLNE